MFRNLLFTVLMRVLVLSVASISTPPFVSPGKMLSMRVYSLKVSAQSSSMVRSDSLMMFLIVYVLYPIVRVFPAASKGRLLASTADRKAVPLPQMTSEPVVVTTRPCSCVVLMPKVTRVSSRVAFRVRLSTRAMSTLIT